MQQDVCYTLTGYIFAQMFITHVNFVVFLTNTKTLKLLPEIFFIRAHSFMLKGEGGVRMQAHEQSFSHGLFIYVNHDHEFTNSFSEKNINKTFFCFTVQDSSNVPHAHPSKFSFGPACKTGTLFKFFHMVIFTVW